MAMAVSLLLVLICGSIDFGRALNDLQTMADLTRQGSNLASRGTTLTESTAAVISGESGLDLANHGVVIITSITNNSSAFTITGQATQGALAQTSKIGTGIGTNVTSTLPTAAKSSLQNGQTIFVTEIYYTFSPLTPIGKLTASAISLPSTLYNSAYF
jgi:Flp pilus assembly protein TadG